MDKPVVGQYIPMWKGSAGSGAERIYSVDGKWVKAGQALSTGHKIVGEDKSGNLVLNYHGVPVTIGMQGSHITTYNPATKPMWAGGGQMTTQEEQMYDAMKNQDGSFNDSMGGMHSSFEDAMKAYKSYYIADRSPLDRSINRLKKNFPDRNFGTYSDYQKATPEQQRAGFYIYNNETEDFTDFFKLNQETQ